MPEFAGEGLNGYDLFNSNGTVKFADVAVILNNLPRPGILKGVGVTTFQQPNRYLYVASAWMESRASRNVEGRYFFRLKQGIERPIHDLEYWNIFSWFEIVWLPNSEHDPNKWRTKLETSKNNPGLAQRLTVPAAATRLKTEMEVRVMRYSYSLKDDKSDPIADAIDIAGESSLFELAELICQQTADALCQRD